MEGSSRYVVGAGPFVQAEGLSYFGVGIGHRVQVEDSSCFEVEALVLVVCSCYDAGFAQDRMIVAVGPDPDQTEVE